MYKAKQNAIVVKANSDWWLNFENFDSLHKHNNELAFTD